MPCQRESSECFSLSTQRRNAWMLYLLLQISNKSLICTKEPMCRLHTLFILNLCICNVSTEMLLLASLCKAQRRNPGVGGFPSQGTIHTQVKFSAVSRAADRVRSHTLLMLLCEEVEIEYQDYASLSQLDVKVMCLHMKKNTLFPPCMCPLRWWETVPCFTSAAVLICTCRLRF